MNQPNKNIECVKRFIEAQIKPGEKYDFDVIQKRFNYVLARGENKSLRNFRLILEKINYIYKYFNSGKDYNISDWYLEKLREFIGKYKQIHSKKKFNQNFKPTIKEYPPSPNLYWKQDVDRGTYYQEANNDEFGCVLVCNSEDK